MNNNLALKKFKLRRFDDFFKMSIVLNAIAAILSFLIIHLTSSDANYKVLVAMYLIVSFVFWVEIRMRLSNIFKDNYLMIHRQRSGYKSDIDYNVKGLLVSLSMVLIASLIFNLGWILAIFIVANAGLIVLEMKLFYERKPKISQPIDEKIADLRVEIISIFYKLSLEKMRSTEKIYRISVYLDLGELDYFLNHTDLIEEMYDELRAKIDQLKNESDLYNLNCFIFSLTCRAYLYASDRGQADLVSSLKEKAVTTAVIENRYEVMRYLD